MGVTVVFHQGIGRSTAHQPVLHVLVPGVNSRNQVYHEVGSFFTIVHKSTGVRQCTIYGSQACQMFTISVISRLNRLIQMCYREEKKCRFCTCDLPDWREAFPPLPTADPVMLLKYNGRTYGLRGMVTMRYSVITLASDAPQVQ
jgi:hypothetical protein